jgi:hypothetical protein
MLQRSKIAEDLLVTMARLFGPVPGGLGISVVFVGALLAATTGIVGATVVAMGLISLPAMLRNNYSVPLATGTIAASGHARPDHPAVHRADHPGRPARQRGRPGRVAAPDALQVKHRRTVDAVRLLRRVDQRRRDVPRRLPAGPRPGRAVHAVHPRLRAAQPESGAGGARGRHVRRASSR